MAFGSKTPLGRVRGLGSAHGGTGHFTLQRLTAIANLVLVPATILVMVATAGLPYAGAVRVVSHPVVAILLIGAVLSITVHMRVGMQVIIEDYVHHELTKIACVVANTLFTVLVAIAGIYAVLRIGLAAAV